MSGSALSITFAAWVLAFGASVLGMWFGSRLPEGHKTQEMRDLVSASAVMVSTLTAIALGLLLSVADASFDDSEAQLRSTSGDLMRMDHLLRLYGPELEDARSLLREYAGAMAQDLFPPDGSPPNFENSATLDLLAKAESSVALRAPDNDTQRWLRPHVLDVSNRLIEEHFALVKGRLNALPPALVLLLLGWLILLFGAYGLFAPRHGTSVLVLFLTSGATAGGILLILELETPVEGFVRLSAEPLQHAIEVMEARHISD